MTGQARSAADYALGFTLLEMLVVLAMIGIAMAAVGPRLGGLYDSVTFAMSRETLERDIANLPYQAYKLSRDLALGSISADGRVRPPEAGAPTVPASLALPPSWSLEVDRPIVYRATGFCSGGVVTVRAGISVERYVLRPPVCAIDSPS
jgi:prepilin-type N-terminal cleavage/methylation domain-containing protein